MRNSTVPVHQVTWTLQISPCRSATDWTLELLQHPLYCCFRMSVCARAALVNAVYACFGTEYGAVPTECNNKASSSFSHRWGLICWLSGMCSECLFTPRFFFVVLQMVYDVCQEAANTWPVYVEKLYWHIWLWGTWHTAKSWAILGYSISAAPGCSAHHLSLWRHHDLLNIISVHY